MTVVFRAIRNGKKMDFGRPDRRLGVQAKRQAVTSSENQQEPDSATEELLGRRQKTYILNLTDQKNSSMVK